MADNDQLPQLPLMLAGVPRPIADLLREAGVPVACLDREALTAQGAGRFVLFDSRSSSSASRAKRAQRQGLELIDVATLTTAFGRGLFPWTRRDSTADLAAAGEVLDRLKLELESRGGIWLRMADYPFPYQSAVALGVEHSSLDAAEVFSLAEAYPLRTTHFVSTRLNAAVLADGPPHTNAEWGWLVGGEARAPSADKHAARWVRQLERFQNSGLVVRGLALVEPDVRLPPIKTLLELGFDYHLRPNDLIPCRMEPAAQEASRQPWVRFGAVAVSPQSSWNAPSATVAPDNQETSRAARSGCIHSSASGNSNRIDAAHVLSDEIPDSGFARASLAGEWALEWVTSHYKSGTPLFLRQTAGGPQLAQTLLELSSNASRCSLMWQTSFDEFSRWWRVRRRVALQVWRTGGGFEIHADGDLAGFPPAIEVWRGSHVATLPLRQPVLKLLDDGLVFLKSQNKRPAGFSSVQDAPADMARRFAPIDAHSGSN